MTDVVLEHLVEKGREGSYYSLPFQVPEGVVSLTVTYSYPRIVPRKKPPINVIDLGLEDAQGRFLGWSGSSRKSVTAGEFAATPGYCMSPVQAGTWHILVGAYHVQTGGVLIRYRISFEKSGSRWLFGDLHVHSTASDGQYDIPILAKKAKALGLDYLAVTDHNNYAENYSLPRVPGLTMIPGVEWTHYRGHMNFFGLKEPFTNTIIANDLEGMRRIAAVGDAEDHVLLLLRNPAGTLVEIQISGGAALKLPVYTVIGTRGALVSDDEKTLRLRYLDPKKKLPPRRATLALMDSFGTKDDLPWVEETREVRKDLTPDCIWDDLYAHLRFGKPFRVKNEEALAVMSVLAEAARK